MILVWLILIPFIGGLLAWAAGRWRASVSRGIALLAMLVNLLLAIGLWAQYWQLLNTAGRGPWLIDIVFPWMPQVGISLHLALDGISLLLVLLTAFLGTLAVAASWQGIQQRVGFFYFNLLWSMAGITGIFLAFDLFLFYFFWEMMLIPLYFLIDIWGLERRHYAAVKFFIFTQVGGLFLLLGILGLYFVHGATTGEYTFDYFRLLGTAVPAGIAFWLMLGFFFAFAVKLPVVPVHTWLPDAHTQAPVAGSVDLAGLVLKVGAYGLLRFTIPLFPAAALGFTPIAMLLGVIGIIYGAILAFGQTDIKRLVAYTSVSHMGYVLLGIFAWNALALQGAMIIIIAHGIVTGALFILIGSLSRRIHTREMDRLGGLWANFPRMGGVGLFLAIALLGLPGLGSFIGEFLVLLGTYRAHPLFAAIASVGFVLSVIYALWFVQRVFFGPPRSDIKANDLSPREMVVMAVVIAVTVWVGLFPQAVLDTAAPSLNYLRQLTGQGTISTPQPPVGARNKDETIAGAEGGLP